jgi:hypothetical protein
MDVLQYARIRLAPRADREMRLEALKHLFFNVFEVGEPVPNFKATKSSSFQGMDAPRAAAKREYHSSRLREMESASAQARNRSGRVVPSTG